MNDNDKKQSTVQFPVQTTIQLPIEPYQYLSGGRYQLVHNSSPRGDLRFVANHTDRGFFMTTDMVLVVGMPSDAASHFLAAEQYNEIAPKHMEFIQEKTAFLFEAKPDLAQVAEWLEVSEEELGDWLGASLWQLTKFSSHVRGFDPAAEPPAMSVEARTHNIVGIITQLLFRKYQMGMEGLPPITMYCKVNMTRREKQNTHIVGVEEEKTKELGFGNGHVETLRNLPILPGRPTRTPV